MVFSSLLFIFKFLPFTLLFTYLSGKTFRNLVLLLASLFFYAWGERALVVLMLISILANYHFGLLIERWRDTNEAKLVVIFSVIVNLGLLVFFKYFNFIINNVNFILHSLAINELEFETIKLPIGISFFTFQALSYVVDIYRNETKAAENPMNVALYIAFFPQLIAGPIVRWKDISLQIENRDCSINKFSEGIHRFIFGLSKKVLLANPMGFVADKIYSEPIESLGTEIVWLGAIAYMLQIYFDFSGYSDMAIGLGKMFGFEFLENFNYPYISTSIKEFWRRWHISLSTWFRDYVYIPLGGNKASVTRTYINLILVFCATGIWHGANWTFLIWGLYHGFFLILERIGLDKLLQKLPKFVSFFYTSIIILIGWIFFRAESFDRAMSLIKRLFIFKSGIGEEYTYYTSKEFWVAFVIGIIVATPVYTKVKNYFKDTKSFQVFELTLALLFFWVSVLSISTGNYNPFIYFRF